MNYYKRFVGAIQRKTSHLSPAAMGCYDRLLDWYYANERPIPLEPADGWRICGAVTADDQAAVTRVLAEFFERTEAGWTQGRAEEELPKAQARIEAARRNGAKGGRPSKAKPTENPAGSETETQREPSRKPRQTTESSSSPPSKKKTSPLAPQRGAMRFPEFWQAWPANERKQDRAACLALWKRNTLDDDADAILADVRTKRGTEKWRGGFIEAPLVYLRNKRWEDGVQPASAQDVGQELDPWASRSGIERVARELGEPVWTEAGWAKGKFPEFTVWAKKLRKLWEQRQGAPA